MLQIESLYSQILPVPELKFSLKKIQFSTVAKFHTRTRAATLEKSCVLMPQISQETGS